MNSSNNDKPPAPRLLLVCLVIVFVIATLATAFALTLATSSTPAQTGVAARFWDHVLRYGWANGLAVSAVFAVLWLVQRRR